ncbi:MAG: hypothetical protein CVU16_13595 [Betaproteobacteria bacterium HGW-Betaproteobacteria-10]|nr:MAG: hypothetical protein CVU16_13595 [Betaproteobacteria bacterium HGW-Betaproteobacteria-10]
MSLVACRACGHQVDTTAEACPGCGATNPGRKMSRQQHDLIILLIQLIVGIALVVGAGTMAWKMAGPIIKQQLSKPSTE